MARRPDTTSTSVLDGIFFLLILSVIVVVILTESIHVDNIRSKDVSSVRYDGNVAYILATDGTVHTTTADEGMKAEHTKKYAAHQSRWK